MIKQIIRKSPIIIKPSAHVKLKELYDLNSKKYILFHIKGGGCAGFSYQFEPTDEEPLDNDTLIKNNDFSLYIDSNSLFHLLGTTIDWKIDFMGSGFVFNNPLAKASCGCGTSFTSKKI
jgi:iron-sulfur cluster assembly accessory protein|tara:strand:+ start:2894 stop:3250 length:357 start_codon:yes stop_codon:yes gene_type:complete